MGIAPMAGLATLLLAGASAAQVRRELGVMVPMGNGVRLAADVWRPAPRDPGRMDPTRRPTGC
ncbi:MAG: hypothetical protein FJ206_04685 [Gemmatimonadetes bacterium]|nr:hypothetical protein [Gemmatimonadota bacterium]